MRLIDRFFSAVRAYLPKGLYARSLIIIIAPIVLLEAALTHTFFERHWQRVTHQLSNSVASEIAFILADNEFRDVKPGSTLETSARETLGFLVSFQPGAKLPPYETNSILENTIRDEFVKAINKPIWFDVNRRAQMVDIRVDVGDGILQVQVRASRVYATNWHIFLVWMVVTSIILLSIAILFLRNQVRPILRLAYVAEAFGKGRDVSYFKPAGAREVRAAAQAFIDMRDRIRRHIEQRTEMLAGVSHDLRTPLTRMKLELAMMPPGPEVDGLRSDVADMEHMVEEFLEFSRGQGGEEPILTDLAPVLAEVRDGVRHKREAVRLTTEGPLTARLRRQAIKRCVGNLVDNAATYGRNVEILARRVDGVIEVSIDDDGPGIPTEQREEAFRPFTRLDQSRTPDASGVGLGLAIARDIARVHGGDITLSESPLGGLRAQLRIPV